MGFDAANLLSLSRAGLAAYLVASPRASRRRILAVMVLAGLSDLIDGPLARRHPGSSRALGAWLDPLCDKAFALSVLLACVRAAPGSGRGTWIAFVREIVQAPLTLAFAIGKPRVFVEVRPRSAMAGKLATALQFATLGSLLLGRDRRRASRLLARGAGAAGAIAAIQYTRRVWVG